MCIIPKLNFQIDTGQYKTVNVCSNLDVPLTDPSEAKYSKL